MQIHKATRQGVKPLIVLYSESGCGKTYSALLLARGFVGPSGKMVMVDTESGRGSLYADIAEFGGYDVLELEAPFSPARCVEAIDTVESSGATIGIFDSGSHEWEGSGGVLDMAAENEAKSGKGLNVWRVPKLEHSKFIQRLLRSKIPWIVCLRAKYKTRQGKDEKGKTVIIKDEVTSPIQAEDFIFEATCHAEILPRHNINLTKHSHPALKECFPSPEQGPITLKHGQMIAAWCAQASGSAPAQPDTKDFKAKLWKTLKPVRGTENTWDVAEGWMLAKKIITDADSVSRMTVAQLIEANDKAQIVLDEQRQLV